MYFKNISNILVSIFDLMNFFMANWLTGVKLSNSVIHKGPIEIERFYYSNILVHNALISVELMALSMNSET